MAEALKIAILTVCYNRREKTLKFLESLFNQQGVDLRLADIYILDDGSTDGTAQAVKKKFPRVDVLTGTGNLFWAAGMRTLWQHALHRRRYDIFLLFNDDVVLYPDAVKRLIDYYMQFNKSGTILIGSVVNPVTNKVSYGGNIFRVHPFKFTSYSLINPDASTAIPCMFGNANILLIDEITVNKIGVLADIYTHYMADFDYTYTAYKAGVQVLISPGFYGYCKDDTVFKWLPLSSSLKERIQYLYSPKGLTLKEYMLFIKKHFPNSYVTEFAKMWLKTLFPFIWDKFKPKKQL